jgi:threonine synthase
MLWRFLKSLRNFKNLHAGMDRSYNESCHDPISRAILPWMKGNFLSTRRFSYLTHLSCSLCGQEFDPAALQTFCAKCKTPLVSHYDLNSLKQAVQRAEITSRRPGMWRWHELLPVSDPAAIVTLGEGDTPMLSVPRLGNDLGMPGLLIKDESLNPTGSFKARGLAAAISKAHELGVERVIIPTAGNAGGAMAAYAARCGMQAAVYMPKDTPAANMQEVEITGAELVLVDGLINDAAAQAGERAKKEGWFDVSTFKEPYRLEGKKVMGLEIAQQLGWQTPDVIVYPTGGGTGLVGIWKAFQELAALGWLDGEIRTRMVAVQADGCAPVVKSFESGAETCELWPNAHTHASGLRVPRSFADRMILQTLRQSQGTAVAVSDTEIDAAQRRLAAREGLFAAPEGAATLAGLEKLLAAGWVKPDEKVVLLNTATGLKYLK